MGKDVKKNFANSKKLTEGEIAFQQYDAENKDKIGSSTPPIDLEKGPISTMSPNVTGDETQVPIIGGGQLDYMKDPESEEKVEKDYAPVTGVYSTQHQIPGEMSNLITAPTAVDAAVETKRKNILNQNSEPYFDKMDETLEDDDFFKTIDDAIFDEEGETTNLAKKIELSLNSSLRKSINSWFFDIAKTTEVDDALVSLKKSLIGWHKDISKGIFSSFSTLVDLGFKAGIRKSKVPISKQNYDMIKSISMSEKGISSSLYDFSDLVYSKISKCVKDNQMGSYKQKRAIDFELKSLKPKTKSLLKSEVAKFGNFGMESALEKFKEAT